MDQTGKKPLWPETVFIERNNIPKGGTCKSGIEPRKAWEGPAVKNPPAMHNTGDVGSIPGSGRSPGEGNGNTLWCSCLGNPMDRGAWRATVHSITRELDST